MIKDCQVDDALKFMRDNAEELSAAMGQSKYLDHKRKIVRSQIFLEYDGTVAEREAKAETSDEYRKVVDEILEAETLKSLLQTQFKRAEMTIELYRTESANQRRGNI